MSGALVDSVQRGAARAMQHARAVIARIVTLIHASTFTLFIIDDCLPFRVAAVSIAAIDIRRYYYADSRLMIRC